MKVLKSPTQFKMLLVWFTFCWILKNYVIWQGKNDIFYICFLYRMIYERVKFNLIQKQVLFFLSRCYFSSISVSEILKHTIGSVPIFTGSKKCTSGTRNTMLFPKATQIFCQRKWKSRRGYLCLVSAFFCCVDRRLHHTKTLYQNHMEGEANYISFLLHWELFWILLFYC